MRKLYCLHCQKPTVWEDNPWRPFCCERCKMIDLGHWIAGDYAIPGDPDSSEKSETDSSPEDPEKTLH